MCPPSTECGKSAGTPRSAVSLGGEANLGRHNAEFDCVRSCRASAGAYETDSVAGPLEYAGPLRSTGKVARRWASDMDPETQWVGQATGSGDLGQEASFT